MQTKTPLFPPAAKPVTERQTAYLNDLLDKVDSKAVADALRADLRTLYAARLLDTKEASRQIDRVKAILTAQEVVKANVEAQATEPVALVKSRPEVATGRYAVTLDGVLRFYLVKNEGGRYTVKRYMSDTLTPVKWGEALRALAEMERDPQAARMTFARETRRCYTCGRRLTDKISRERGQGPDCAGR